MKIRHTLRHAIVTMALTLLCAAAAAAQAPAPLKVMSFNIRYGTAKDGDNHWDKRRQMLFDLLRAEQADIVGVQEALHFQLQEILEAAPDYGLVGIGRTDGKEAGEYSAILYRKPRLTAESSGTFWFSDTPEAIASKSWGNNIERICTWARFTDAQGRPFYLFNLHLDHQSQPSREKSAQLLMQRIAQRSSAGDPVIVTGDFNSGEDNAAIRTVVGTQPGQLIDTFRALHADTVDVGTFTGFKFGDVKGEKIDYVLVQPGTKVISSAILRTSKDDRYPSDHFPVTAEIQFAK